MLRAKAIDIIANMSDSEKSNLRLFLQSPYFNKNSKLVAVFDRLCMNLTSERFEELTEEELFQDIFEGRNFSYSFMRNLMSELLSQCETFLVVNRMKKEEFDEYHSRQILLSELNSRGLDKLFTRAKNRIISKAEADLIDTACFEQLSKIESETVAYHLHKNEMKISIPHIEKRALYELCLLLQMAETNLMDFEVNKFAYNEVFGPDTVSEILSKLDSDKVLEACISYQGELKNEIELRIRLLRLCTRRSDEMNYFRAKELFYANIDRYSNSEKLNLFIKLKNYCAFRIYDGRKDFIKEKYELLKMEIKSVRFCTEGVGPVYATIFMEIVQRAIQYKETDFALDVVRAVSDFLEPNRKESVINFAMAQIEFELGNYEKALTHLAGVEQYNLFTRINSSLLYLKIFYDTESFSSGDSVLQSLRHLLYKSKELHSGRKNTLKKAYNILSKLYKTRLNPGKVCMSDLIDLSKEIESSDTSQREWFLKKLNELKSING